MVYNEQVGYSSQLVAIYSEMVGMASRLCRSRFDITLSEYALLLLLHSRSEALLTRQIADFLMEHLEPQGVAVVIEAEHLCMTMRGAMAAGAKTTTSALRGSMRSDARTRSEALSLIL